ncbi:hypothetical protein B0T19DRAFT_4523 [Cercophora scortea]|uniref:Uncharacterized protein n=1 Tax=Cercophora scortea TaxID=314031 RepID=A0AAE0J1T1_9PEZI|nr:hypothetical protein B0T19DRAFT_4523 [Cercophora scortea]
MEYLLAKLVAFRHVVAIIIVMLLVTLLNAKKATARCLFQLVYALAPSYVFANRGARLHSSCSYLVSCSTPAARAL